MAHGEHGAVTGASGGVRSGGLAALVALTLGATGTGCGSSTDSSDQAAGAAAFDARSHCERVVPCEEPQLGPPPAELLDLCVDELQQLYDGLDSSERATVDRAYSICRRSEACDYHNCLFDESDAPSSLYTAWEPTVETCAGGLSPGPGEVISSEGPLPYDRADVQIIVGSGGCVGSVTVDLVQGDCSVSFTAEDNLDAAGRLLINNVYVFGSGACNYPATVKQAGNYLTSSRMTPPFGTIAVVRPDADWRICAEGEIVIAPDVVLENIGDPNLILRNELRLTGELAKAEGLAYFQSCPEAP